MSTTTEKPKTPKSPPGTHTKSTLFIRNIPSTQENSNLEEYFSEYGPLRSAFIVKKAKSKTNIAFVHFALPEDAKRALEDCNGSSSKYINFLDHSKKNKEVKKEDRILVELALRKKETFQETCEEPKGKKEKNPSLKVPSKKEEHLATFALLVEFEGNDLSTLDKKMLWKRFRKSGPLTTLTYPYLNKSSQAHLLFPRPTDAKKAMAKLDSHVIRGITMKVTQSLPISGSVIIKSPNTNQVDTIQVDTIQVDTTIKPAKENRLIIRNLSFKAGENEIKNFFASQALIPFSITIPKKANSSISSGFAFVQMKNSLDAGRAIESLNNESISGRVVAIDYALSKTAFLKSSPSSDTTAVTSADTVKAKDSVDTVKDTAKGKDATKGKDAAKGKDNEISSNTKDIFIRNLPFGIEEESLKEHFEKKFGPLCYMKLVRDPASGAPRGTAFARFEREEDAFACLKMATNLSAAAADSATTTVTPTVQPNEMDKRISSLEGKLDELSRRRSGKSDLELLNKQQQNQQHPLMMEGRLIHVMETMSRGEVEKTINDKEKERASLGFGYLDSNQHDRRNTFLIREGLIRPLSEDGAKFFPSADVSWRDELVKERKGTLKKNPNNFVSPTRLSFRHLPPTLSESEFKTFLKGALQAALKEKHLIISEGECDLSGIAERMSKHAIIPEKLMVSKAQALLLKDRSTSILKIKQVKLISSKEDGSSTRNKGYGFVEMCDHYHALLLIRFLTQFSPIYWRTDSKFLREHQNASNVNAGRRVFQSKVPLIEFATEKASIIAKRQQRMKEDGHKVLKKDEKKVGGPAISGKRSSTSPNAIKAKKSKIDRF